MKQVNLKTAIFDILVEVGLIQPDTVPSVYIPETVEKSAVMEETHEEPESV